MSIDSCQDDTSICSGRLHRLIIQHFQTILSISSTAVKLDPAHARGLSSLLAAVGGGLLMSLERLIEPPRNNPSTTAVHLLLASAPFAIVAASSLHGVEVAEHSTRPGRLRKQNGQQMAVLHFQPGS